MINCVVLVKDGIMCKRKATVIDRYCWQHAPAQMKGIREGRIIFAGSDRLGDDYL